MSLVQFTFERIVMLLFFVVFSAFLFSAMYEAAKGRWEQFFFSAVGLVLTFLLGAAWVGFATDHMDVALGALGIFALATSGLVFFAMQSRSENTSATPSKA